LAQAIATKGDYKLKCSPDYMVPENERLNVSRKKKHLFLHYQYLFEEKKDFNKRLDNLRLKKKELV
jgi:cilia- and flagella-associated protein 44